MNCPNMAETGEHEVWPRILPQFYLLAGLAEEGRRRRETMG